MGTSGSGLGNLRQCSTARTLFDIGDAAHLSTAHPITSVLVAHPDSPSITTE